MKPATPRGRRRLVLVLALALAGGTATWSLATGRGEPEQPGQPAARTMAQDTERGLLPPIYGYLYTWNASGRQIALAKQELIVRCMAERGFQYTAAPVAAATDPVQRPTPFGVERLEAGEGTGQAAPDESLPPEKPQGEAFTQALLGDPKKRISAKGSTLTVSRPATGCQAEAENRLLGDERLRRLQLRLQLKDGEDETLRLVWQDKEFRAVGARWRACLNRAGFDAADPVVLRRSMPADADPRTQPAIRADVRCKAETGYLDVAYGRLAAVQRAWLDERPQLKADWKRLRLRQEKVAREVLG